MVEQLSLFTPVPVPSKRTVYTLGYSGGRPGLRPREIATFARRRGVTAVDTRVSPRSRVPYWTKAQLQDTLGNRYVHIPDFGNLNYKSGDDIDLRNPARGYTQLAPVLAATDVLLLCACKDITRCHRALVADYIAQQADVTVQHLTINDLRLDNKSPQGEKGHTQHGTL